MVRHSTIVFSPGHVYLISGATPASTTLLDSAWQVIHRAYRPSTLSAHRTHFRTYLAFIIFMDLPKEITLHNILTFLEYLHKNALSVKVIRNYLASISTMASLYNLDHAVVTHPLVNRYLRGLSLHSPFRPTPRGIFDVHTLYLISQQCDTLPDPILFRAIFLTAFYAFLRMSNMAPHSLKLFDPNKHFLRQDVIFAPPGAHLILKWCKTMQDNKSHHVVQIPQINNYWLCPVRALRTLLISRPLHDTDPLFANKEPPFNQVIDTVIRDALKQVLANLKISRLTTIFPCRTSWHMAYGVAPQCGHTYKMLPKLPLLSPAPLLPSFRALFDWVWCFLKFCAKLLKKFLFGGYFTVLTCK